MWFLSSNPFQKWSIDIRPRFFSNWWYSKWLHILGQLAWTQGSVMGYLCITSSVMEGLFSEAIRPKAGNLPQWGISVRFQDNGQKDIHWQCCHTAIPNLDHPGSIARHYRSCYNKEAPGKKLHVRSIRACRHGGNGKVSRQGVLTEWMKLVRRAICFGWRWIQTSRRVHFI